MQHLSLQATKDTSCVHFLHAQFDVQTMGCQSSILTQINSFLSVCPLLAENIHKPFNLGYLA